MDIFQGLSMTWFTGVVEDVTSDPLKLGRVKVRIHGIHTDKKIIDHISGEGIETVNLPWAVVMQSANSASVSGIGTSSTGLVNGTTVVGISRDGAIYNDLIIIGTIPTTSTRVANVNQGFNDPDGVYPLEDKLNEPDMNRLARNDQPHELIEKRKSGKDSGVVKADKSTYDEPDYTYNAQYPYNFVNETRCGHIFEIDDTEGSERINTYHTSGSFTEFYPDGSIVTKAVKDFYNIVNSNQFLHTLGNYSETVEGNFQLHIVGNTKEVISQGNYDYEIEVGDHNEKVTLGNRTIEVSEKDNTTNIKKGNEYLNVDKGNYETKIKLGNYEIAVDVGEEKKLVNGKIENKSNTHIDFIAPTINVGSKGLEPMVMGDKLETLLMDLIAKFNAHVHLDGMVVTTTPPISPPQTYSNVKSSTIKVQK